MYNELIIFEDKKDFNQRINKNTNGVSIHYLATYAELYEIEEEAALLSLKIQNKNNRGCWCCKGCTNCINCIGCIKCSICQNSFYCYKCVSCYNCLSCEECLKVKYSKECKNCKNCSNCDYCVDKINFCRLKNKNK